MAMASRTFGVTDEYADGWIGVEADDLHDAAERYVAKQYPCDPDLAQDGSIRVEVRRPDGEVFRFVVHIEYEPTYLAKMIHDQAAQEAGEQEKP
jgi:hypothetical protein